MTIEELNKLIKEELDAYLGEDDDIEVTTDEPGVETGEEALDILRQIFDLIKPTVEPEGGEEKAPEVEDESADEEEPAEEEEGDPEAEEGDLEEGVTDFVGSYNPGPTDFGTGMALLAAVAIGLPLVSFMSMNKEDKKEFMDMVKANAADFKAAAKLRGTAALNAIKAAAEKAGLTKFANAGGKGDMEENLDRPNYKASDVQDTKYDAEKIKGGLNESVDMSARFKKLANIK